MATNINKYPHFVENQVLRSSTLNDSFAFVDEQARLTRVHLLGSGIVEGLEFSSNGDTLNIHPGVAVDKDGWLVRVTEKTEYQYAAAVPQSEDDFISDSLTDLFKTGGSHISMVCFRTEDDIRELGLEPVSVSDINLENYVVALAFGRRNETAARCSQDRCDINIVNQILEPWPVLIPVSDIQSLYRKISPVSLVVLPQKGPCLENSHGSITAFNEQMHASFDAWKSEICYALNYILVNVLLMRKASDGSSASPWDTVFNDGQSLIKRFVDTISRLKEMEIPATETVPDWFFSFYGDMLMAINEFVEEYNGFAGRYHFIPNHIPADRLIYLGSPASASGTNLYCSMFKASMDSSWQNDCARLEKMLCRICVLSECFIGNVPVEQLASYPFKVLKIRSDVPLSKRPVPFYYDTDGSFFEFWNADMSSSARCIDDYPESAQTGRIQHSKSDGSMTGEGYGLYPMAYQGKEWSQVRDAMENLNKDMRLSLDIEEAGLRTVEGLTNENAGILVKLFQPFDCRQLKSSLTAIRKNKSGITARFAGFVSNILTEEGFVDDLGFGRLTYQGSYKDIEALVQIKESEVREIVEEMKKSAGLSEGTYPKAKDSGEVYAAFRQLIHVCGDSFFYTREGASPEGFGRVVFMGPVSRGSKVYLFTRSLNNAFDENTPRTVVSYGVDYLNPESVSEEEATYLFRIALARAEKGKKLADLPEVVSPYSDGGRWNRNGDRITIYPCVDDTSRHLYSTDISNIISEVSDPKVISVVVDEVADVENCIPAIGIQMFKNGTSAVTLKIKDSDGNILHTRTFTVAVNNPEWNAKPVTGVSVSQSSITGLAGHTCQLSAAISPATATNKGITWSSSDQAVARVDQNGLVTLIGAGTASITVTTVDGAKTASTQVAVSSLLFRMALKETENGSSVADFPNIISTNDSKWDISSNRLTVYPCTSDGQTAEFHYTQGTNIMFNVSNPDVLSVQTTMLGSSKGPLPSIVINLLKNGNSKVTLSIRNDDGTPLHTRTFTVLVNNPAWNIVSVTGISLSPSNLSLVTGQSSRLAATVLPANATDKKVIWTSAAPSTVTVDQNGNLSGRSMGSTKITASTADGSRTASASVTVSSLLFRMMINRTASGEYLADFPDTVSPYGDGGKWAVINGEIAVYPHIYDGRQKSGYGTDPSCILCEVSDSGVLSVSKGTMTIGTVRTPAVSLKLLKNGTSRVTLKVKDTNGSVLYTRIFTVNVNNPEWNKVAVTGVSLPVSTISLIIGQKRQISPTVLPSNATNKKVIWSYSGTPSTAASTIDQTGMLTARIAGSNTIYAKTEDGSKQASAVVSVSSLLFRMALEQKENGESNADFPDIVAPKNSKWSTRDNTRVVVYPYSYDGKTKKYYATPNTNILYEVSNPNIVSIKMSNIGENIPAIVINLLKTGTSRVTLKIKDNSGTILHARTFTVNVVK